MTYIKCCDKPNILLFYQGVAHNIRLILLITFLFMQKKTSFDWNGFNTKP